MEGLLRGTQIEGDKKKAHIMVKESTREFFDGIVDFKYIFPIQRSIKIPTYADFKQAPWIKCSDGFIECREDRRKCALGTGFYFDHSEYAGVWIVEAQDGDENEE